MLAALLALGLSAQTPVFIENDFAKALAEAKQRKVPLFVDAWAPWCHTCVFMREHVLHGPALQPWAKRYVFAAIDTEEASSAAFLAKYPVEMWPTLFIIDPATETVALQWLGSGDAQQLGKLLDDGELAVKQLGQKGPTEITAQKLALADLKSATAPAEAAALYKQALDGPAKGWPRRPRAIESMLAAEYRAKQFEQCAKDAVGLVPTLPKGPSFANATVWGLSCAGRAEKGAAWAAEAKAALVPHAREAVKLDGLLADDRSGLYELLVEEAGDSHQAESVAAQWLSFLEGEAKKAKTPAARAVFDPHRVSAALAAKQPERVVAALEQSERELPKDYNPPARLALVLREQGKLDEALQAADRALGKVYGPRTLRVLETKASIYKAKGDVEGQRATLTLAVQTAKALPDAQRPATAVARLESALAALPKAAAPKK